MPRHHRPPLVLAIGGHDPSGAGIQADIETVASFNCHAVTLVTCLTTQNTGRVAEIAPTTGAVLERQFELVRIDARPFLACKIGLIPSVDVLAGIAAVVARLPPGTPTVLDPVLAAGSGGALAVDDVRAGLLSTLWPHVALRTPNARELRLLADAAGCTEQALLAAYPGWTLVKGADEPTSNVVHRLYRDGALFAAFEWPRIEGSFHGSGCTLASAIAALLARGMSMASAVGVGLAHTWRSLTDPLDIGGVQMLPNRRSIEAST